MSRRGAFIDNYSVKQMLHARIVRSTIHRGKIISTNLPPLKTDYHIIGPQDLPGDDHISVFGEAFPLLKHDEINYKGEPIFLICGPNEWDVRELDTEISVTYNEIPSLPDPITDQNSPQNQPKNIPKDLTPIASRCYEKGNIDHQFTKSAQIIEGEYTTAIQYGTLRSPLGALAIKQGKQMVIHTGTQWPFHVRHSVAKATGIPEKDIIVHNYLSFPSQDEKVFYPSLISAYAAILSLKSNRPVRLILDTAEQSFYISPRPPVAIYRKTGLDLDGNILAEEISMIADMGAYPLFTGELLDQLCLGAAGFYPCQAVKVSSTAYRSNKPPMNAYKGLGIAQGIFSLETHYSRIAELLDENPALWKQKFFPHSKTTLPTGGVIRYNSIPKLMEHVIKESDFHRKYAAYEMLKKRRTSIKKPRKYLRGIGIAGGYIGNGFSGKPESFSLFSVSAKLDKNDNLSIKTSGVGSGHIWRKAAGDILGINSDNVFILPGDTSTLPDSGPSFLANEVSIVTSLVENCCNAIKKQRFKKPLPIEVKRTIRWPSKSVWNPSTFKGTPFHTLSWGAVVVEIELDVLVLHPLVRGVWVSLDCGRVYDQERAKANVAAEVYESLKWCYGEESYLSHYYHDYGDTDEQEIISLPSVWVSFNESKKNTPPGGVHLFPEALIPAAFVAALSQATSLYFDTLPVTPKIITQYMEEP